MQIGLKKTASLDMELEHSGPFLSSAESFETSSRLVSDLKICFHLFLKSRRFFSSSSRLQSTYSITKMPITPETKRQDRTLVREVTTGTPIQYPAKGRQLLILLCLVLGTFLVAIDTTIISVAIPTISTNFEALHDVGWYGSAYLMILTAFQPTMSKIYKSFSP